MAKSNSPSFAKIGLTVFLGVIAIVGTLIYLGGVKGQDDLCYAETYYTKSVSGLSVGSPVNFRGVKLGEVCEIGFVGDHYSVMGDTNQIIYVKIAFPRKKIHDGNGAYYKGHESFSASLEAIINDMGMRATVTASGITGLSRLEIDNRPDVPIMPISWAPRNPYIPPAVSLLDNFSDSATRVMNQINKMDLTATWSNVNETVRSLAKATESVQAIVETHRGDLEKLSADATAITTSLRELVEEVKTNPAILIRDREVTPLPETTRY